MNNIIGILGGMGPAATVDAMTKIIRNTNASKDQEHIPIIALSIPDIPDRSACILNHEQSPLNKLIQYTKLIENAGAQCLIIPCNTAHYWFEELKAVTKMEMISIIDATLSVLVHNQVKKVGLLATDATISSQLYNNRLLDNKIACVLPTKEEQSSVMKSIYEYKAGNIELAKELIDGVHNALLNRGVEVIIMGCTELPLILSDKVSANPDKYIDTTEELVKSAINWYQARASKH
ncbi:aspartate/glutamate racemase family protein [Serratia sp. L9]|uniref:aspartate/glutamate racemase family protein n=1 Tax=Serratia sp. L9 TaxID=3423946 RepID=UPI003D673F61